MPTVSLNRISKDPVINLYMNLLKHSQGDLLLPAFSEIYLRLALKERSHSNNQIYFPAALQTYRKLLVLYYNKLYPSITDVQQIMQPIFNNHDLIDIICDQRQIIQEWQKLTQSNEC